MRLPWRPMRLSANGPSILTSLTETETTVLRQLAFDADVLEIGSAFGYSTIVLAQVARHVTSVDPHIIPGSAEEWLLNLERHGLRHKVTERVGYSGDALDAFDPGSFDLIFIDGDHSEEMVSSDIRMSLPLLRPGGQIALHDYDEESCPGVRWPCDLLLPTGWLVDTLWVARP